MSKPFKMKGFSGFGNSPAKQKPGGGVGEALDHWEKFRKSKATRTVTPKPARYKGPSVARTHMAKPSVHAGIARGTLAKLPGASTLTKAAKFAGRMIPGIGLASLLYKPTKKGTAKKVLQKSIRTIKDK